MDVVGLVGNFIVLGYQIHSERHRYDMHVAAQTSSIQIYHPLSCQTLFVILVALLPFEFYTHDQQNIRECISLTLRSILCLHIGHSPLEASCCIHVRRQCCHSLVRRVKSSVFGPFSLPCGKSDHTVRLLQFFSLHQGEVGACLNLT